MGEAIIEIGKRVAISVVVILVANEIVGKIDERRGKKTKADIVDAKYKIIDA